MVVAKMVLVAGTVWFVGAGYCQPRPQHRRSFRRARLQPEPKYWSWFAPRSWTSVDNANGITITSGDLRKGIDIGASSLPVRPVTPVTGR